MAKTFRTSGAGSQQTLHEIEDEKIPVYDTTADAEADLANLAEEQIVATKDAGGDEQTLIEYVDGRLETTTTEIAMDTFKTGSKARLNKSGNTVQFNYYAEDYTTYNPIPVGTWTQIGTIPAGLRPKQTIVLNCQGMEVQGESMGIMSINPAGVVNFLREASSYNHDFSFQCSYNVDGTDGHGMTVNTLKDAKDYTDARAVRKYDYTMTGTTDVITDIQVLCAQLVSLGDNTYSGEFFRSGQTSGHYSISVKHSNNSLFVNGIVTLGQDINTASTWTVHRLNDVYHIRESIINKNIVVSAPSTPPSNVYDALYYQLASADWTFLYQNKPIGTTATGKFELSGYYWGNYTATYNYANVIAVTGSIDWNSAPHSFSALYDSSTWRITIDGERLEYNSNGLLVTSRGDNRTYRVVCNRAPFNLVGSQLQTFGLYGRQAFGRVGLEMNVNIPYKDTDLIALTNNTYNWPAGDIYWWSNPIFYPADMSSSVWPMYAQNDNHFYKMELWGTLWDQCYVSGGFEFTL